MSDQLPRVAVVGAGRWGFNHVRNFHALGALAAVVDPDAAARARVAELDTAVATFETTEGVLADPAIQAVVLATPAPRHFDDAVACLEAGKDVLVEKPMALTTMDAQAMADAAKECDRILMVGHLLLYQPAIAWLRDTIRDGAVGEVWHVECRRLNLGTVRTHENVLWSFSPHDLAVIHILLDEPELRGVQAFGQANVQSRVEDQVHADFRFAGGATAHVHASWFWPEKIRTTTVIGSEGMLVYDEIAQEVRHYPARIDPSNLTIRRGETVFPDVAEAQPLRLECEHFLACVQSRRQPLSHAQHGVEVVRMLAEATEAMTHE